MTHARQTVKFQFENAELLARVAWDTYDGGFNVEFFDSESGWSSATRPRLSYQDNSQNNEDMRSLLEAVWQWETWTDNLDWADGAVDVFQFSWDGKTREGMDGEYKTLTQGTL